MSLIEYFNSQKNRRVAPFVVSQIEEALNDFFENNSVNGDLLTANLGRI
jgi:hypothetical protein